MSFWFNDIYTFAVFRCLKATQLIRFVSCRERLTHVSDICLGLLNQRYTK